VIQNNYNYFTELVLLNSFIYFHNDQFDNKEIGRRKDYKRFKDYEGQKQFYHSYPIVISVFDANDYAV